MIEMRTIKDPIRPLAVVVIECYIAAIKRRDYDRASWIARNFPILIFHTLEA